MADEKISERLALVLGVCQPTTPRMHGANKRATGLPDEESPPAERRRNIDHDRRLAKPVIVTTIEVLALGCAWRRIYREAGTVPEVT